jgi:hypothetical protein
MPLTASGRLRTGCACGVEIEHGPHEYGFHGGVTIAELRRAAARTEPDDG